MEFAEWVVSGLDQLRSGQLPGGDALYQATAAGLGDRTALDAYMNGGDDAARAELVQAIAQAVAANPGFEQQLRQAAENAQSAQSAQATQSAETAGYGAAGKPPFLKTTNGMLVAAAAAVIVVGGGIGLGVGLSGGGGSLGSALKGTWHCSSKDQEAESHDNGSGTLTIGDGTWRLGDASGTWKQDGGKVTLVERDEPDHPIVIDGVPTGTGSVDTQLRSEQSDLFGLHVKGTTSSSAMHLAVTGQGEHLTIDCTK